MKKINFSKKRARATKGNFFLGTTARCTKKISLNLSESDLKNKSLEYKRSENLCLKSWVKNFKLIFFNCLFTSLEVNFVLLTTIRSAKKSSLCWSLFKFKSKSTKYEKGEKITFKISIWVKKWKKEFYLKMQAAKQEVSLFLVQSKYAQSKVLYLVRDRIEKQEYEVRKKFKTII